jgi:hypothetical protein
MLGILTATPTVSVLKSSVPSQIFQLGFAMLFRVLLQNGYFFGPISL